MKLSLPCPVSGRRHFWYDGICVHCNQERREWNKEMADYNREQDRLRWKKKSPEESMTKKTAKLRSGERLIVNLSRDQLVLMVANVVLVCKGVQVEGRVRADIDIYLEPCTNALQSARLEVHVL